MDLIRRPRRPAATIAAVALSVAAALVASCASTAGPTSGPASTEPAHKVTVAGDSISVGLGAALRGAVGNDAVVKVIGEDGTGLARPDRFDWPARLRTLAREFPPQVLVFSVGSNDAQDLTDADGRVVARFTDTTAWDAEYTRRLAASFDAFASSTTRVVWVGHVRTEDPKVGGTNRRVHRLATEVAATRPFVSVSDFETLLRTEQAGVGRCLMPDGLHLTVACLDEAAAALSPSVRAR